MFSGVKFGPGHCPAPRPCHNIRVSIRLKRDVWITWLDSTWKNFLFPSCCVSICFCKTQCHVAHLESRRRRNAPAHLRFLLNTFQIRFSDYGFGWCLMILAVWMSPACQGWCWKKEMGWGSNYDLFPVIWYIWNQTMINSSQDPKNNNHQLKIQMFMKKGKYATSLPTNIGATKVITCGSEIWRELSWSFASTVVGACGADWEVLDVPSWLVIWKATLMTISLKTKQKLMTQSSYISLNNTFIYTKPPQTH